jgi:hypothetical protein
VSGGPVFVVGPMGSGTTLARLVLDSHPSLAIAPETGFARLLLAHEQIPFWKFGAEWYGRLGISPDELDGMLRDFYGGIYSRFAQSHGATRWGDKTPFHTWHIHRLARVFPDAVFVATARHPGAVAASLVERFRFTWPAGVRHWVRSTTEMLHRGRRLGDRFALCRYEDLVTDPEPLLRQLFDWLGEPWDEAVLSFHEVHRERGTAAVVEGRTRSDRPLDPGRVARWADAMPPDARRLLRRETASLAEMLGYRVEAPMPVRELVPDHPLRRVATGTDVAGLVRAHPDVDFSRRPRPTLENRPMRADDIRRLRRLAAAAQGRPVTEPSRPPHARLRALARRLPRPVRTRLREIRSAVRRGP